MHSGFYAKSSEPRELVRNTEVLHFIDHAQPAHVRAYRIRMVSDDTPGQAETPRPGSAGGRDISGAPSPTRHCGRHGRCATRGAQNIGLVRRAIFIAETRRLGATATARDVSGANNWKLPELTNNEPK